MSQIFLSISCAGDHAKYMDEKHIYIQTGQSARKNAGCNSVSIL
jgi:hypothetical protein